MILTGISIHETAAFFLPSVGNILCRLDTRAGNRLFCKSWLHTVIAFVS